MGARAVGAAAHAERCSPASRASSPQIAPQPLIRLLSPSIMGHMPIALVAVVFVGLFLLFTVAGYAYNRARGVRGVAALPMWDYYAKRWTDAPVFEPTVAVSVNTPTPR